MARTIRRLAPSLSRYGTNDSLNADIGQISTRYKQHRTNVALNTAVKRAETTYQAIAPRMSAWQKSAERLGKTYAAENKALVPLGERYQRAQQAFSPLEQGWKAAKSMQVGKAMKDPLSGEWRVIFPDEYRRLWWSQYGTQYQQTRSKAGTAKAAYEQQRNAVERLYGRYTGVTQRIEAAGKQAKRAYNVYEAAIKRRNAGYYPV